MLSLRFANPWNGSWRVPPSILSCPAFPRNRCSLVFLSDSLRFRKIPPPARFDFSVSPWFLANAVPLTIDQFFRRGLMSTMRVEVAKMQLPTDANASGRTFGIEELDLLRQALGSGTLNCTKGTFVSHFEKLFAQRLGVAHCTAVTSGTAALHCAVAAVNPNPGDEIISSPITDMGAITPILYQGAIPVFADVDPSSLVVTAETIAARITRRTKAIIVTHLFGNVCDMDAIMELAKQHNLVVIEDAAQALDAKYK